jgi:NTP pyrophosphatase (non-canonical NTP hydrolase)
MTAPDNPKGPGGFAFGDAQWPGIAKLAEECGEVVQVIGKLMMTHGSPAHWSGNLRAMLVDELGDLAAAIGFVGEHCLTAEERGLIAARIQQKLDKFEDWHANFEADPPPPLAQDQSS